MPILSSKKVANMQNSTAMPQVKYHTLKQRRHEYLELFCLVLLIYYSTVNLVLTDTVTAHLKQNATQANTTEDNIDGRRVNIAPKTQDIDNVDDRTINQTGLTLDCEPGEQRQFNYESSTRVWGCSKQQVRLRATIRIRCMEPSSNVTLKYLAEIVSIEPNFGHASTDDGLASPDWSARSGKVKARQVSEQSPSSRTRVQQQSQALHQRLRESKLRYNQHRDRDYTGSSLNSELSDAEPIEAHWIEHSAGDFDSSMKLKAEPLLDEVVDAISETTTRFKRSVSSWFGKTWNSVKEFFVNIFQSSERTTASRDEILRETGLDIAGQCKVGDDKHKGPKIPIDDSVFEDLGPEYYVGASLDPSASTTSFDFNASPMDGIPVIGHNFHDYGANEDDKDESVSVDGENSDAQLSFFDDPKYGYGSRSARRRLKRASPQDGARRSGKQSRSTSLGYEDGSYERQLYSPFVFTQTLSGKIIDIRLGQNESDSSIRNFKRHLCDLFATNLDAAASRKQQAQQSKPISTNEVSPLGKHTTKYLLDTNGSNSEAMKQLLMETDGSDGNLGRNNVDAKQRQFAVKVLAMVGATSGSDFQGRDPVNGVTNDVGNKGESSVNFCDSSKSDGCPKVSTVLRSINTTSSVKMSSKAAALATTLSSTTASPDSDQIQVRVKQVQQISDGRLTATAGQLIMSLAVAPQTDEPNYDTIGNEGDEEILEDGLRVEDDLSRAGRKRWKRDSANQGQVEFDVADLLAVSSSFSMQLVPVGSKSYVDTAALSVASDFALAKKPHTEEGLASRQRRSASETLKSADTDPSNTPLVHAKKSPSAKKGAHHPRLVSSSLLVTKSPNDTSERERILQEWRRLETCMQLTKPSQLLAEQSDNDDGSMQRLEILRNQIGMRLNEEFVRQRVRDLRRRHRRQQQVAALRESQEGRSEVAVQDNKLNSDTDATGGSGGDNNGSTNKFGLSLTQLILGGAITARQKGLIYDAVEETLELELSSGEDDAEGSISRLLKDTVRIDRLRSHCRSAIASFDDIARLARKTARIEVLAPFNVSKDADQMKEDSAKLVNDKQVKSSIVGLKSKKLQQCKQVLGLVLRAGEPKAADLVVELIDLCNSNLLSHAAQHEELGYGPMSRYYRSVRQQFTELLTLFGKTNDQLLDKLMARLQFGGKHPPMDFNSDKSTGSSSRRRTSDSVDFEYVPKESTTADTGTSHRRKEVYNKTLLREDDHNNNDGAGSLVMTITTLAAKPTVSRSKQIHIINKLLNSLKSTKCSLFDGPDLDIIESMSNFGNTAAALDYQSAASFSPPFDDLVNKVVQLAHRCGGKQPNMKRAASDQYVIACVHGLSGQLNHTTSQRFLLEQLKSPNASCTLKSEIMLTLIEAIELAELKPALKASNARLWPVHGINQLDEALLDIVQAGTANRTVRANNKHNFQCLSELVAQYFRKKQAHTPIVYRAKHLSPKALTDMLKSLRRQKRAVVNDNQFWDEAQCRRWSMPDPAQLDGNSTHPMFKMRDLFEDDYNFGLSSDTSSR